MMRQPFEFYVDSYNLFGSRRKALYRFTKQGWESLMRYRQWEIEDAVKAALDKPKMELLKEVRHMRLECASCVGQSFIGGAAMTAWVCQGCKLGQVSGSTNYGIYCKACALSRWSCERCGTTLDTRLENTNHDQE